ncbi:MAG: formylglycine-generating enzyme family protein [Planctomycetota bacterium]|jgi:formylglycine-generating enzyme required for sulfatase activity
MKTVLRVLALGLLLGALPLWAVGAEDEPDDPPAPGQPAPEEPAAGEEQPAAESDDETTDEASDDGDAEEGDGETDTDVPRRIEVDPPVPGPPGMVFVPGGTYEIGTNTGRLANLVEGRDTDLQFIFFFESPRHEVTLLPYFMDANEVTNAQYLVFLQDSQTSWDTTDQRLANLQEIAGFMLGTPAGGWIHDDEAWQHLYEGNRDALWEAMPDAVVRDDAGEPDLEATKAKFKRMPLVRGIELRGYTRRTPNDWAGIVPAEEMLDHPVRWVSYLDAEAFAEWAGKHIPTEAEWEICAAGPHGFYYPWGNEWFPDGRRANWGAHYKPDEIHPMPIAVGSIEEGVSPYGAYDMLGNLSEWTSSWFMVYPGNSQEHPFASSTAEEGFVKVIRGGNYLDQETLVLRVQARNFVMRAPRAPPRPGNRFETVGFRCAWYPQPGLDTLTPTLARIIRGKQVRPTDVRADLYAGAIATHYTAPDAVVENHVTVTGRASAVVLAPLATMLAADVRDPKIRKVTDLLKFKTDEDHPDPIPLAVFHTDLPLAKVWIRAPLTEKERKEREKARRRGKILPPKEQRGVLKPGSYILAWWFGRLCLVDESLEWQCFLTKEGRSIIEEVEIDPAAVPAATVEVTPDVDLVELQFTIPVGGHRTPKELALQFDLVLETESGSLSAAGDWRSTGDEPQAPSAGEEATEEEPAGEPADEGGPEEPVGAPANGSGD